MPEGAEQEPVRQQERSNEARSPACMSTRAVLVTLLEPLDGDEDGRVSPAAKRERCSSSSIGVARRWRHQLAFDVDGAVWPKLGDARALRRVRTRLGTEPVDEQHVVARLHADGRSRCEAQRERLRIDHAAGLRPPVALPGLDGVFAPGLLDANADAGGASVAQDLTVDDGLARTEHAGISTGFRSNGFARAKHRVATSVERGREQGWETDDAHERHRQRCPERADLVGRGVEVRLVQREHTRSLHPAKPAISDRARALALRARPRIGSSVR
jgi:hypothetical protein